MDWQLSKSPLPVIWVIETLARSNRVDVSILLDLLEKSPQIADNLGKNARELVFLRILETILGQGAQSDSVSSASSPKVAFHPSESCEDVVQQMLLETSVSNLIPAGPHMCKWDVQTFISHKRSSLPTHALQQLKNAILTGSHSFLVSLKEQSGLPVGSQPERGLEVDDDKCNGITPRFEATETNTHNDDQLSSPALANSSNLLQSENLLPVHGKKRAATENNTGGNSSRKQIITKNGSKIRIKFVKKYENEVLAQSSERERCSLDKDTYVGGIRLNEPPGDDIKECFSSKELVGRDEVFPCEKQVPRFGIALPNDKSGQENEIEKAKCEKEGDCDLKSAEDVYKSELSIQVNVPNGVEEETILISSNSKCTYNQDFSAKDWRDLNMLADLCSKIVQSSEDQECGLGKRSNFEFTSSKGLIGPDEVLHHEKEALHRDTKMPNENFDELKTSNVYTNEFPKIVQRNVPNLVEAEEENDISVDNDGYCDKRTDIDKKKNAFLSSQCTYTQGSLATIDWKELNVCVKCNKGGKLLVCSNKSCLVVIHESCLCSDASFSAGEEFYCPFCAYSRAISKYMEVKKKMSLARNDFATFVCRGTRKESKKQHHRSNRIKKLHLEQDDGLHEGNELNKDIAKNMNNHLVREKRNGSESHGEMRSKKRALCSPETDLPREYKCSPRTESADDQEISEEKNEDSGASKYFIRVRKHERKNSFPSLPQLRRKRLSWTTAEEEKLKEGIRRFCSPDDKFIPWKKIQEFGAAVFHESRSTIDLKDKWRNLCKASSPKS